MNKNAVIAAGALALAACADVRAPEALETPGDDGSALGLSALLMPGALGADVLEHEGPIEGRYFVVFERAWLDTRDAQVDEPPDGAPSGSALAPGVETLRDVALLERESRALASDHGVAFVTALSLIDGFLAEGVDDATRAALEADARVSYLEPDTIIEALATQTSATWGLDRIDQDSLPLDRSYTYEASGAGVTAYVIDSGIRSGHSEFRGRFQAGVTYVSDGRGSEDCSGHGTHVAGTIAGSTFGVAKGVTIVPVRAGGCGTTLSGSGIVGGLDWVVRNRTTPAVVNMSLGGSPSRTFDTAVANAVRAGVVVVVAAGNESQDACNVSPAREASAITVGATTSRDGRASFSNYGRCVDLFAPGQSITSSWYTSDSATNSISGTSMASPHVAGVVALYLERNRAATPAQVTSALLAGAVRGGVADERGAPDLLVSVRRLGLGDATPPPAMPPPATPPADGAPCTSCDRFTGSLSSGARDIQPGGTYYMASSGTHRGWLRGPGGTDFDLRLYRWDGRAWAEVASSLGTESSETISYASASGYFLWTVSSYSGSGAYELWLDTP